jgi:drug/metabolite transporter (DMT)-like permease
MTWLAFALLTVVSWGVYGVFLHNGQMQMADKEFGRYKAFLFVGIAYFLTAVLAPLILLWAKGADWKYPVGGMAWSLVAGIVGAIGAFGVLLAFGAKGAPPVVMAIIFAGAPVVNALVSDASAGRRVERYQVGILGWSSDGCLRRLPREFLQARSGKAPARPSSSGGARKQRELRARAPAGDPTLSCL